jgi:S1-C subfamily serine protease
MCIATCVFAALAFVLMFLFLSALRESAARMRPVRCVADNPRTLADARRSVVVILGKDSKPRGAGVIVADELCITAAHCLPVSGVVFSDGTRGAASVIRQDTAKDLALVRIVGKCVPLPLGATPRFGDCVIVIGHPQAYLFSASSGIVSAVYRDVEYGNSSLCGLLQFSAPVNPGNSGGPLLNERFEMIGLVIAMHQGAQGIGFAHSVDTIKAFMKGN